MKKIECIIMDWAGTAVDYGCFAPVAAFLKAFAEKGLTVTMEEARGPMGMTKIDHIRELFKLPSVTEQFKQNYNRNWTEEDVVSIYKEFEKHEKNSVRRRIVCSCDSSLIRMLESIRSKDHTGCKELYTDRTG